MFRFLIVFWGLVTDNSYYWRNSKETCQLFNNFPNNCQLRSPIVFVYTRHWNRVLHGSPKQNSIPKICTIPWKIPYITIDGGPIGTVSSGRLSVGPRNRPKFPKRLSTWLGLFSDFSWKICAFFMKSTDRTPFFTNRVPWITEKDLTKSRQTIFGYIDTFLCY